MKARKQLYLLKIAVWAIAIVAMLMGCKSRQQVVAPKTVEIEKTVTKTIRDTTFVVEPDSSFYKAWIECVNGKPILRNPTTTVTRHLLKAPTVGLSEKGDLYVECETEILELQARIEDLVTELNSRSVEYVSVEVEKELTFWQSLFIWLGRITFFALVGLLGYGAFKLYLKIFKPLLK